MSKSPSKLFDTCLHNLLCRLDGKAGHGGAVITGVSLEASAESGLAVATSTVGTLGNILVVSGGGGGELEKDDNSTGGGSTAIGISKDGGPSDVVVNLNNEPVLKVSTGEPATSTVVPLGDAGGLLGVDLGDGVQVTSSTVGIALIGASSGGNNASEGGGGRGGNTPASIDDEELVSLLEAVEKVATSTLATGINVGVDLVGVSSGPVSGDGVVLVLAITSGMLIIEAKTLNGSSGGVDVGRNSAASGGQVTDTELVGGTRVIPDKVELSLSVGRSPGHRDSLDGMGERAHEEVTTSDIISIVPVVDVNVVGGITITVSEASLKELLLSSGKRSQISKGSNLGISSPAT